MQFGHENHPTKRFQHCEHAPASIPTVRTRIHSLCFRWHDENSMAAGTARPGSRSFPCLFAHGSITPFDASVAQLRAYLDLLRAQAARPGKDSSSDIPRQEKTQ